MTECKQETFAFTAHFSRRVEAGFTAGQVSSDGGAVLLREVDGKIGLLGRLAECFTDGRSPLLVKHQLAEMPGQRIYGLALGYEDLIDHEQLRSEGQRAPRAAPTQFRLSLERSLRGCLPRPALLTAAASLKKPHLPSSPPSSAGRAMGKKCSLSLK
jgi:hypothetical protein